MSQDTATFEVWLRGRKVASFTGSRSAARAEAEEKCVSLNMGKLAWIKEAEAPGRTAKRAFNALWTGFVILIVLLTFWYG